MLRVFPESCWSKSDGVICHNCHDLGDADFGDVGNIA